MLIMPVGSGSAAADPALVTLGAWSAATAISATNWAQANNTPTPAAGLAATAQCWIKLSDTLLAWVFRKNADDELWAASITLDANGSVSTVNNAQDLSGDFTTGNSYVVAKPVTQTAGRLVIASPDIGTPRNMELGVYDLSGGTFTRSGAIITKAFSTDANASAQNFGLQILSADYGIVFCRDGASNFNAGLPFKLTTTQGFGTVAAGSYTHAGGNGNMQNPWPSTQTALRCFETCGTLLSRWDLSAGTPPTLAETTITAASIGSVHTNHMRHWGNHPGLVVRPPVEDGEGEAMVMAPEGFNFLYWDGTSNEPTVNAAGFDIEGSITPSKFDAEFVQIDTDGDWVRGVLVSTNGTTGLMAQPMNINVVQQRIVYGAQVLDTTITPHISSASASFSAFYLSTGPHILIFCEDTTAAPSYLELAVTP